MEEEEMSEDYYSDGVNTHVTDTGSIYNNGNYWGEKNQFGEYVSGDGNSAYKNIHDDIVDVSTGENAGHVYHGEYVSMNNSSSDSSGSSSSGGYVISDELRLGAFFIFIIVISVFGSLSGVMFATIGVLAVLSEFIGIVPAVIIGVCILVVFILILVLVIRKIIKDRKKRRCK